MRRIRGEASLIGCAMAILASFVSVTAGAASPDDAIRIGVLLIDAGPLAGLKDAQMKAAQLAIDDINAAGGVLGKKLAADFLTYSGTPDAAVDAATRAAIKDGDLFITGMSTGSTSTALTVKLRAMNILMMDVMARPDSLTRKGCSSNYFRVTENDSMVMGAVKEFLVAKGIKKWDEISVDYATGRDSAAKFAETVESQGGSIGKSLFAPPGTADFGAKISLLGSDPADGLYVTIFGSDAVNLAKQQQQFGLFSKYKLVLGNSFAIPQILSAQGAGVVGVYQTLGFTPEFPGAESQEFVRQYQQKYVGEMPAFTGADQYAGVQLIVAAIKKANSTNLDEVRRALSGLKAKTVIGDVEMRAGDHQAIRPISINQVVLGEDGKPRLQLKSIEEGAAITPPVDSQCGMSIDH
jgi:branched-chain amino acid transport system substrate-binding protein